jgi:hypothetical protein
LYFDVNNNGIHDPGELFIGGVDVRLTGIDVFDSSVDTTVKTNQDGVFLFENVLASGIAGYSIQSGPTACCIDGIDNFVDPVVDENYDPGVAGNDVFTGIKIGLAGTERAIGNYRFGERGVSAAYTILPLPSDKIGLIVAIHHPTNTTWWFTKANPTYSWEGLATAHAQLASDHNSCVLTIVDTYMLFILVMGQLLITDLIFQLALLLVPVPAPALVPVPALVLVPPSVPVLVHPLVRVKAQVPVHPLVPVPVPVPLLVPVPVQVRVVVQVPRLV